MYLIIFWSVFIVVFFGALSIILGVRSSKLSRIREEQEEINDKAKKLIQDTKFKQTKILFLNDYATLNQDESCKKFISIDSENKKICLIDYSKESLVIVGFDEVLNYEIYENGSQQTVGGNVNGIWAGLFEAETTGMCKELKLIIRLNRYDISQVCYEIISNTSFNMGVNKSSNVYKQCIDTLQETVSFLEVVKNKNMKK